MTSGENLVLQPDKSLYHAKQKWLMIPFAQHSVQQTEGNARRWPAKINLQVEWSHYGFDHKEVLDAWYPNS